MNKGSLARPGRRHTFRNNVGRVSEEKIARETSDPKSTAIIQLHIFRSPANGTHISEYKFEVIGKRRKGKMSGKMRIVSFRFVAIENEMCAR